jgi:DNA topoisomerase-1
VHPEVITMFKEDRLLTYLKKHNAGKKSHKYLSPTEELVMKMLKSLKI